MDENNGNGDDGVTEAALSVSKGRARRSPAQWAELIEAWRESGQSIGAFCGARGLAAASFYGWRRRLSGALRQTQGEASAAASVEGGFVRLRPVPSLSKGVSGAGASGDGVPPEGPPEGPPEVPPAAVVVRFADGVELHTGGERLAELVMLLRRSSGQVLRGQA